MSPPLPAHALPALINHLLAQEPSARATLAQHAGSIARIVTGVVTLHWKVRADGLIEAADPADAARVTITVNAADLPLIAQNRERAFSYVKVDGDAEFANVISQLSQSLRWEAEHDLSRWIGDIAAARVVAGGRAALLAGQSTGQKILENVAEYLLEEQPMLVRPQAVEELADAVVKTRNDVERLIKRIEKLETGLQAAGVPPVKLDSK